MGFGSPEAASGHEVGARERILETAYELFSHRGIRDVGVEEVIARAGVAKATLYRHFPHKDDLVIAFLELEIKASAIRRAKSVSAAMAESPPTLPSGCRR